MAGFGTNLGSYGNYAGGNTMNVVDSMANGTYMGNRAKTPTPTPTPVLTGNPNAVTTAPPQRSFSQDQQYLRDTANTMYGKGQPISNDMRDYYSQKWADNDMNFGDTYPIAPVSPVVQQPRMGTPVRY